MGRWLFVLSCIFLCFSKILGAETELIIFSYDRAMQLYALLESISLRTKGIDQISVLCRASNSLHAKAY